MAVIKKEIVTFKPGELVVQEKMGCDAIYVIQEGQLEVYRMKDGVQVPMGLVKSGEYVGEMALLLDRPHMSSVKALTEVKAVKLPRRGLDAQIKTIPPWFMGIVKGIITRLHTANEVLRRNNWIDEKMQDQIEAIEAKNVRKPGDAT